MGHRPKTLNVRGGTCGMTFLPIVERELRVASRRRGTYWTRVIAAVAAVGVGGWFLLVMANQPSPVIGALHCICGNFDMSQRCIVGL